MSYFRPSSFRTNTLSSVALSTLCKFGDSARHESISVRRLSSDHSQNIIVTSLVKRSTLLSLYIWPYLFAGIHFMFSSRHLHNH